MSLPASPRFRLLALLFAAALPLFLLAGWNILRDRDDRLHHLADQRADLARSAADTVEHIFRRDLSILQALAHTRAVREADQTRLQETADAAGASSPSMELVTLFGPDGRNLSGTLTTPGSLFIGDRPYFRKAVDSGQSAVSEGFIGRVRGSPVVTMAVPVDLAAGGRGALIGLLSLDYLKDRLDNISADRDLRLVVTDSQEQVLIDTAGSYVPLTGIGERLEVRAALAGESGARRSREEHGDEHMTGYAPVDGPGWAVLVEQPGAGAIKTIEGQARADAAVLATALAVIAGFGWVASGRVARYYSRATEATAAAEESRDRIAFLADASKILSSSLDEEVVLKTFAQLSVPRMADWCAVDLADPSRPTGRRRIAVEHVDLQKVRLAWEIEARYPAPADSPTGVTAVLRSGQPHLGQEITDELLQSAAQSAEHLQMLRSLGPFGSYMVVPLKAGGEILGAMTFVTAESGRRYLAADLAFAEEFATRASLAVHNARLYRQAQEQADEQRRLNLALQEAAADRDRALEEVQRETGARDAFLTAAAHDLRNPVATVRAVAQLLRRQMQRSQRPEDAQRLDALSAIEDAALRMGRLIDELLDLARLQMGTPLDLIFAPTDLVRLIRDVVARLEAGNEGVLIRLDLREKELPILCDANRLDRAVENLVENAIKYSPRNAPIDINLERSIDGQRPCALLEIRDKGIGIPEKDLPHVFERFRRGSNVQLAIPGTGIGLATVRQTVEQHGGTIAVYSREHEGSIFTIRLPLQPDL